MDVFSWKSVAIVRVGVDFSRYRIRLERWVDPPETADSSRRRGRIPRTSTGDEGIKKKCILSRTLFESFVSRCSVWPTGCKARPPARCYCFVLRTLLLSTYG